VQMCYYLEQDTKIISFKLTKFISFVLPTGLNKTICTLIAKPILVSDMGQCL